MLKHFLSVLGFMIVSFSIQGLNHFVLNTTHYESIDFARAHPIMALGILAMLIQGSILTFAMTKLTNLDTRIRDGLVISLTFGLFLAAYIVLAEPAKYAAPSLASWMITEAIASLTQFTIFGFLLGLIHSKLSIKFS